MIPLFDGIPAARSREQMEEGVVLLRGFAGSEAYALFEEVGPIAQQAPFRHLLTPGGYTMSVAMTNCGRLGCRCVEPRHRAGCAGCAAGPRPLGRNSVGFGNFFDIGGCGPRTAVSPA
jgi:hypothetical protein